MYGDRVWSNFGIDHVELLRHVVDHPLHALLAGVDVADHLEQLVAIVEVVQKGDSVTEMGY